MDKSKLSPEAARKLQAMTKNMFNFLTGKGVDCKLIEISKVVIPSNTKSSKTEQSSKKEESKEEDKKEEITHDEKVIPVQIITGSHINNLEKKVNFIVKINKELKKETNGQPQVELLIESTPGNYINTHPQTNPHIMFLLNYCMPNPIAYQIPKTKETSK